MMHCDSDLLLSPTGLYSVFPLVYIVKSARSCTPKQLTCRKYPLFNIKD